jgi:hypothetical protein
VNRSFVGLFLVVDTSLIVKLSCLVVDENAIRFPSGQKEMLEGADFYCLYILFPLVPIDRFHSLTTPSAPPVATIFPLGLIVIQEPLSWAFSRVTMSDGVSSAHTISLLNP